MEFNKLFVLFIVMLVSCIGSVASDIYAPSIVAIAGDLNTRIDSVQFSMAIFMFSFAVSQLFYGPISEAIGRKKALLAGLFIVMIGSVVCFFADTIFLLTLGRFIQGCGAGAGPLFRPIFRDLFKGAELAKYGSYAGIMVTLFVPLAPVIGGYLQDYFDWQASFIFIFCYALFAIVAISFTLSETNKNKNLEKLKLSFVLKTYKTLLTSKFFLSYTICICLSYGGFFAWFTVGPVLLIKNLGLSSIEFGHATLLISFVAMSLAGFTNAKVVKITGPHFMLQLGWYLMTIAGILMLALYEINGIEKYSIVIPTFIFYFGVTLIWPNAFSIVFTPFGNIAGYAGAVYGCMQIAGGAILGSLLAYLPEDNQVPLATVMLLSAVSCLVIFYLISKPSEEKLKEVSS